MRRTRFFSNGLLLAVAMAAMAGSSTISHFPSLHTENLQASQAPQTPAAPSGPILQSKTRLVVIDVVATNGHGNVVSDLQADDFKIEDEKNHPQKIAHFEFIDKSKQAAPATAAIPAGAAKVYSNQIGFEKLKLAPTILLMDALNTHVANQAAARRHMLMMLKTLPADTPVAVLLLGQNLRIVQGFTSEPTLLRAAVDKVVNPTIIVENPVDDDSMSGFYEMETEDSTSLTAQGFADFMKEVYALSVDVRVESTTAALTAIAHLVSGYEGRKSLIWFSESFPFALAPDTTVAGNPFWATREYADKIQAAANALSDAQVSVYPVDAAGLATQQALSASRPTGGNGGLGGGGGGGAGAGAGAGGGARNRPFAGSPWGTGPAPGQGGAMQAQLQRESSARYQNQSTMEEIAKDTGGKTCKDTNDLSGCAMQALNDSSSYYELAFYPEGVNWDGTFHRIHMKTSRHGLELDYRRGFFAYDSDAVASQKPDDRLQQACADWLPSTSIALSAQRELAGAQNPGHLKYLLAVSPATSPLAAAAQPEVPSLRLGICEFNEKGNSFHIYMTDIGNFLTEARTQNPHEVRGEVEIVPQRDTRRVRFEMFDLHSGLMGGLDVPVLPEDHASASPPAGGAASSPAVAAAPASAPTPTPRAPAPSSTLSFTSTSGQSGSLNWSGDKLVFQGDLPTGLAAASLFQKFYRPRVHCESGALVVNKPGASAPTLYLQFKSPAGKLAAVDMRGTQPEFSGDLPMDDSAKVFFQHLWGLCHCQEPPSPGK